VSKNDAWQLILLSDLFPKGTTSFADLADEEEEDSESSGEDYDEEEEDEDDDKTIVN